jgi:hypothetical protein
VTNHHPLFTFPFINLFEEARSGNLAALFFEIGGREGGRESALNPNDAKHITPASFSFKSKKKQPKHK